MDLRRQIAFFRAWLPLIVGVTLAAGAVGFVFSAVQHKVYEAQATLIVGQSLSSANPDYNQLLVSQRLSSTYASVATTRPNLDAVVKKLGLNETADDLAGNVHASAALDSTLLTITAEDTDPNEAAQIANAVADQLIATSPAVQGRQTDLQSTIDSELQATEAQMKATSDQIDSLTAQSSRTAQDDLDLQTLNGQLITLRSTYATLLSYSSANASNLLSVVDPAVPDTTPVAPRTLLNTLLAMALALLATIAAVAAYERFDDRLKSIADAESATGLPTMGGVPHTRATREGESAAATTVLCRPHSLEAEAYRRIRANIGFASADQPLKSLLVTSPTRGDGRTTTAANLAVAFAQLGRKVILADADLRNPGIHIAFNLDNAHGLSSLLRDERIDLKTVIQKTDDPNLRVLTSGPLPPNPADLVGSNRMAAVARQLAADAEIVVFDGPPVEAVADAALLSTLVDGTLLLVDAGRSHKPAVLRAQETLERADARIVGSIVNHDPTRMPKESEYLGYESFEPEEPVVEAPRPRRRRAKSPAPSEQ